MDAIQWIEFVDYTIKKHSNLKHNPFPLLFYDFIDYKDFVEENIDILPIVRKIYQKVLENKKEDDFPLILQKLYIICIYILCIKFYSDVQLKSPLLVIEDMFDMNYNQDEIVKVEIDILKIIEYIFPI